MTHELKINPKFRDAIPPLTTAERQQLRDNIADVEQIREPIITWRGYIIDGHNRYEIAREEGLEYQVEDLYFANEDQVVEWILMNQLGRRNLRPDDAAKLRGRLYNTRKKAHGDVARFPKGQSDPLERNPGKTADTAEEVANETGVSVKTVKRDGKYAEALDSLAAPVKRAIESHEVEASRKDVERLAEYDKASQRQIVESVTSGEAASLKEALSEPADEEPPLDPVQVAVALAPEFDATARQITAIEKWVEGMLKTSANYLLRSDGRQLFTDLKNAKTTIKFCKPHAACPYCRGQVCEDELVACKACKGSGWVNKRIYDMAPPETKS